MTDGLEVVTEPSDNQAGVGVRYDPDARGPTTKITVEQLWPNGDAEPVYIPEDDLYEFITVLMEKHMALKDDNNGDL